ncbi:FMN-linked oxidoreductase [Gymnopus androsaceus JB14]|uniref:FMN-linked oxidoreductase n=1 Tax=Gymnopus androsaceus JB14 TaxID=1447944 RepID=A0A6A4GBK8_9AGAR|nr:FMN-linked oxidoreductase [Gymnopus androsaceus JB14]
MLRQALTQKSRQAAQDTLSQDHNHSLLITQATFIAAKAGGYFNVTDAVHAKGSFIVLQLWALGRATSLEGLHAEDSLPYDFASDISESLLLYATAAKNSIKVRFNAVEIHGANGYFLCVDQLMQDLSNKRTNRCKFFLQVIDKAVQAIGAERTGIRLSSYPRSYLVQKIKHLHPSFAYIHVVEPRNKGNLDTDEAHSEASNDFLPEI